MQYIDKNFKFYTSRLFSQKPFYIINQTTRDNDRDRGYDRGGDRRGGDRDGSRGFDRYEPPRERGGYDRGNFQTYLRLFCITVKLNHVTYTELT